MKPFPPFRLHEGCWAVVKLPPDAAVPDWAWQQGLSSVTRTAAELSIVCQEDQVPVDAQAERGWACLQLEGPIPFGMTGVLHAFLAPLAEAQIPIFAISTYDTDWVLVPQTRLNEAIAALDKDHA